VTFKLTQIDGGGEEHSLVWRFYHIENQVSVCPGSESVAEGGKFHLPSVIMLDTHPEVCDLCQSGLPFRVPFIK
jgi:hypothetical protein